MLATELAKNDYANLSHAECLTLVSGKVETVLGSIRGGQLKFLQVFISSTNLRKRLAAATPEQAQVAAAIEEAIHPAYLAAENTFSINLADPKVRAMLDGAVDAGLMTEAEGAQVLQLATYERPVFQEVTLRDVVAVRDPALLDVGDFSVLQNVFGNRLLLRLQNDLPEISTVRIEMRESHNNVDWSNWNRVNHFYGVEKAGNYYQVIPNNGLFREIRWRGEDYKIVGVMEVV